MVMWITDTNKPNSDCSGVTVMFDLPSLETGLSQLKTSLHVSRKSTHLSVHCKAGVARSRMCTRQWYTMDTERYTQLTKVHLAHMVKLYICYQRTLYTGCCLWILYYTISCLSSSVCIFIKCSQHVIDPFFSSLSSALRRILQVIMLVDCNNGAICKRQ